VENGHEGKGREIPRVLCHEGVRGTERGFEEQQVPTEVKKLKYARKRTDGSHANTCQLGSGNLWEKLNVGNRKEKKQKVDLRVPVGQGLWGQQATDKKDVTLNKLHRGVTL